MLELAVIERYLWENLKPVADDYGLPLELLPLDLGRPDGGDGIKAPAIVYGFFTGQDRSNIGPGPRLFTSAVYEVSVFHDGRTFGASFPAVGGGTVALTTILRRIDEILQDFSLPVNQPDGIMLSCQRESPVRMPERGADGKVYRRDGGLFRFHAKKAA